MGYEPDPADLALSSVPGQEVFDPRKRKFSAEELKPQPMIKKARKVFIPEDLKVRGGLDCSALSGLTARPFCLAFLSSGFQFGALECYVTQQEGLREARE